MVTRSVAHRVHGGSARWKSCVQYLNAWPQLPQKANLDEEERHALIQLVRLAPDETIYSDRLTELGGAPEETVEGALVTLEPSASEIPSFENFSFTGMEMETSDEGGQAQSEPAGEFEWNTVSDQAPSDPSASFADLNEALDNSAAS